MSNPPTKEIVLNVVKCCEILEILANSKRLEVMHVLYKEELCVTELARRVRLSQSALSQHLTKMREAGVVVSRREKQLIYYRQEMPKIMSLLEEVGRFLIGRS